MKKEKNPQKTAVALVLIILVFFAIIIGVNAGISAKPKTSPLPPAPAYEYEADLKLATKTVTIEKFYSHDGLLRDAYTNLIRVGREAFKREDVHLVEVVVKTKFHDQYGNESIDTAIKLLVDKLTFEKYNWEELDRKAVTTEMFEWIDYIHLSVIKRIEPKNVYIVL